MDLSVIIVNYNVKHFLEQCLISALKASKTLSCEIIVVDNHSLDGSVEMVKQRFSQVQLIESKVNLGFSKGNNLGISKAKGEFILLLNPDTLVEEDTFEKVVEFMRNHEDAGGLGVKMIDGRGQFLPESKRGLPTPMVAFYKMFGLARLFPKSTVFGQYHLTYLSANRIHKVDILSGAFMLLRKSVIDQIGMLDETFFMYGEDIDLSYRIKLAGYENYYFPETQIIHYKGESTKKSSVNYVFVFYRAMVIFANKHFSKNHAMAFGFLINLAIYFRASITLVGNLFKQGYLALMDAFITLVGLFIVLQLYQGYSEVLIPTELSQVFFPLFTLIWLLSIWLNGGYDKPVLIKNFVSGTFIGLVLILLLYAVLPETMRFSRAVVLMSGLSTLVLGIGLRYALHWARFAGFVLGSSTNKRLAIVGSETEIRRVENLLAQTRIQSQFVAHVSVEVNQPVSDFFIGHMNQLREICEIFRIDEVIFCADNISSASIINQMGELDNHRLDFKIAPPDSLFVIGSNSINTSGELYSVLNINSIKKAKNQRMKRVFDVLAALLIILLFPLVLLFHKNGIRAISNSFSVLIGAKSWIGYTSKGKNLYDLPAIKKGVLELDAGHAQLNESELARLNIMYAKDYQVWNDVQLFWRNLSKIGVH
ncbi:MAG: glycosyltransferase [Flavobacteriales bacterium]|nr:glycosyltransferase [Flavobacteriales bacterium]